MSPTGSKAFGPEDSSPQILGSILITPILSLFGSNVQLARKRRRIDGFQPNLLKNQAE